MANVCERKRQEVITVIDPALSLEVHLAVPGMTQQIKVSFKMFHSSCVENGIPTLGKRKTGKNDKY